MSDFTEPKDGLFLDSDLNRNNASAMLHAGERIGELKSPALRDINGVPHLMLPTDTDIKSMEHLLDAPKRISKKRGFCEVDGFCSYVNEFKKDNTRIYLEERDEIRAELDDHSVDKPSWSAHTAILDLEHTEEWLSWTRVNKKQMSHIDFIEFLQEHLHTIAKPAGADIVDAARTFSTHRNASFDSVVPAEGGDFKVSYSEEIRGKSTDGSASLPSSLKLILRPYKATDNAYEVDATVNWRLQGTEITFFVILLRTDRILEEAESVIRKEVENQTGLNILA